MGIGRTGVHPNNEDTVDVALAVETVFDTVPA